MTRHPATRAAATAARAATRRLAGSRRALAAVLLVAVAVVLVATSHLATRHPATGGGVDQPATATSPATATTPPFPTGSATPPVTRQPANPATPSPAVTSPTAGDGDPALPTANPDTAAVVAAATTLTAKILNTYGKTGDQWRASFAALLTPDEAARYATADPAAVPAGVIAATPPAVDQPGAQVETVHVPVVTPDEAAKPLGTVDLTMVNRGGVWLGDVIGWTPAR